MDIKLPVVIDISHYEPIDNYVALSPRPAMMIAKATEGATFKDDWFLRHMAGATQIGAVRGVYHFHRKAVSAAAQVKNFCDTVRPIISKRDVIILDVEEGGETAAQLMAWYEGVMAQFPDNPYWIYSRKNLLDPIAMVLGIFSQRAMEARIERENLLSAIQMTVAERTFFKTRLQASWTAGYPANPDLYDSPPSYYIPDQTKWPPVKVWQYTDKGRLAGLAENVDLNWMDAPYLVSLGGVVEPPPSDQDVMTEPFAGVRSISGVRYGWQFVIDLLDPAKVRMEISHARTTDKRETVSAMARARNAALAYNGGEWDRGLSPAYPLDYSVSNGVVYQPDSGLARPSLILSQTAMPKIAHEGKGGAWQAVTGARYIVQGGASPSYLDGTAPQYTEGHNRTCYGVTLDGRVMVLTCDGAYPNQGLTLKQASVLMRQYGAVAAFDGGGGGDTTRVLNGIVTNNPQDGAERRVPEFVLVYAEKETGMAYGIAKERFGNTSVVRKTPSRYGDEVRRLSGYVQVNFAEKVATIPQGTADKTGEMWLKLDDGNYVNWKLFNSSGVLTEMFSILSEPTTDPVPPPPSEGYTVTVTITDTDGWYGEGTVTVKPK